VQTRTVERRRWAKRAWRHACGTARRRETGVDAELSHDDGQRNAVRGTDRVPLVVIDGDVGDGVATVSRPGAGPCDDGVKQAQACDATAARGRQDARGDMCVL
jgi:hypothetical protein